MLEGRCVKGKADGDSWIRHESGQTFGSLKDAMEHEKMLTA